MPVIIKTVTSKSDFKVFARFANRLYKGNKFYVPSMPFDDLNTFDKRKNGAFEFSDAEFYLAYKNGNLVGRVAAIVNYKANKAWNVQQVRFGWIDFIDDIEVSSALLEVVAAFGKARGMTQIVGPLGFTDFDPEGATLHDCAKYIDYTKVQGFKLPDGVPQPVVHAFLGAFVAENYLGVKDEEILDAIRYHTSGKANMTTLGKLIFVADMVEEGRVYDEVESLRRAYEEKDFEECFKECLKEEVLHLINKKQYIYVETLNAFDYYVKD